METLTPTIEFPVSLRYEAIRFEWEGLGVRPKAPVYAIYGEHSALGHTRIRISGT